MIDDKILKKLKKARAEHKKQYEEAKTTALNRFHHRKYMCYTMLYFKRDKNKNKLEDIMNLIKKADFKTDKEAYKFENTHIIK